MSNNRPRARDLGIAIGHLSPGPLNAITDVPGVQVGHCCLIEEEGPLIPGQGPVRTGVTAILPHSGNLFTDKVCAAVHVINGFGKSVGFPQVNELGNIETPILLTGTLSTWNVANALVDYMIIQQPDLVSVNPVVGECNDSFLNDIQGRHIKKEHVFQAINSASETNLEEGCVGAGVGMTGFGWKGGIGTSSRRPGRDMGQYTVGVLTLTNTGSARDLRIDGIPFGKHVTPETESKVEGSIMFVLATDAPLSARQLGRVARRVSFGLARIGGTASHGSGDFVIAFTTGNRISQTGKQSATPDSLIEEIALSELFNATIDATEEAILNSLLRAETTIGRDCNTRRAIPIDRVEEMLDQYNKTWLFAVSRG